MPELFGLCAWNSFGTFYYFAGFNGYLLLGYSEQEMELFFQKRVYLSLFVKVDAGWRENEKELKRFGYIN